MTAGLRGSRRSLASPWRTANEHGGEREGDDRVADFAAGAAVGAAVGAAAGGGGGRVLFRRACCSSSAPAAGAVAATTIPCRAPSASDAAAASAASCFPFKSLFLGSTVSVSTSMPLRRALRRMAVQQRGRKAEPREVWYWEGGEGRSPVRTQHLVDGAFVRKTR